MKIVLIGAVFLMFVLVFGYWGAQLSVAARYNGTLALVSAVPYIFLSLVMSFVLGHFRRKNQ